MLQPPNITEIDYNGNFNYELQKKLRTQAERIQCSCLARERVLNIRVMQALSWSLISWHIEDMHKRLSMCNTNPENVLKSIRHPGHVNGRVLLSSEFKESSDPFTFFSFELLLLRAKLVATEDPSKFDPEELVFLRPHTLDLTKKRRWISELSE